MKTKTIEFFSTVEGVADTSPILSAKDWKPAWVDLAKQDYIQTLKNRNDKFNHVYQCPGIFDLQRQGFIVPMWFDVIILTDKNRKGFGFKLPTNEIDTSGRTLIDKHDENTMAKYVPTRPYSLPFFIKINTPWHVIAPKGVKFLVLPIAYPDSHEFESAIGILDPGISSEINVQVWWNVLEGETFLKAGTPLCQLIPISEDTFDHVCRTANEYDKKWVEKSKFANSFTFRPRRNLIKDLYHKHFGKK